MKRHLDGMKGALLAALTMGLALGAKAADPVASVTINGKTTEYETIAEAWAEAKTGTSATPATIKLLKDVATEATLGTELETVLTFDLNGKTLSAGADFSGSIIDGAGENDGKGNIRICQLTIHDGTIAGSKETAVYASVGMNLTLDNVVLTGNAGKQGGALHGGPCSQLFLKDCVFTNNAAVAASADTGHGGAIWLRSGSFFKCLMVRTRVTGNRADAAGGGVFFIGATCLAAGTRVRLADGTETAIENVREGDLVATFDHEGGTNSFARVYLVSASECKAVPFTLEFAEDAAHAPARTLSIVGCHDLLEQDSRKYVTITEDNAGQYIGRKFYGEDGAWHTLTNVTRGTKAVAYYSLYTAQHQNVYANGLLTVCDDVDYLLNIYELDENLKADADRLAADIATYGLATFEEAASYGMSRAWYEDVGTKYLCIAIGKGLVSREYVESLFASTGQAAESDAVRARPLTVAAPKFTSDSSDPLVNVGTNCLTLGEGVIVTDNTVGQSPNETADNINLATGATSTPNIALASNHAGLCAGVTRADGTGQFTTRSASASDVPLFTSDNPEYHVWYHKDGYLRLCVGIQVGDDAGAVISNGVCTVSGTGDMWSYDRAGATPLWVYRSAITNLVVESGITGVGARFFENMWYLTDVKLGADCTNVAARAFKKCYGLTNVVSQTTEPSSVGDYAFAGCHSLQTLDFGEEGRPEFGEGAYTFKTAIYMRNGIPDVYTIPQLKMGSYAAVKQGSNDLQNWEAVTDETKTAYHFFRIVLESMK